MLLSLGLTMPNIVVYYHPFGTDSKGAKGSPNVLKVDFRDLTLIKKQSQDHNIYQSFKQGDFNVSLWRKNRGLFKSLRLFSSGFQLEQRQKRRVQGTPYVRGQKTRLRLLIRL